VLDLRYEVPFLAHAPLEPMNCTASVSADAVDVWAPTQAPDDAREAAANTAGLPIERVTVHTTMLGGGFGRRAVSDFVVEAVEVSKAIGMPVQLLWSREDDMRHGRFRDASLQRLRADVGDSGLPTAWWHRVASTTDGPVDAVHPPFVPMMGATDSPYSSAAELIDWVGVETPIPFGIWRSVGHSYTAFAIECFIDEFAERVLVDPLEHRLRLLGAASRLRGCLARVAAMSGWTERGRHSRALGLAVVSCFGSHIAVICEVLTDAARGPHVAKVWCAVDCGIAVNPDGVKAQIEGGAVFALTATLYGRISVAGGRIVEGNFDRYRLLRMDEMPSIEVELIASTEAPGGVGELGVPAIAPAVANAWYRATGIRVRRLPITA
jgi:isoquinoline 1-oxidoreductase subunit beta